MVDDLNGTVHRRYGSMPNMTWVIDRGGRIAYRANWTNAGNVEAFLTRYLAARADRSRGPSVRYETEQLEFRQGNREEFYRRLRRNGPRAVTEFDNAAKFWAQNG